MTPVSAEAFLSRQNLIIQDAHALDETSKQNLLRHLQKCTKAFQKSSALVMLQEDRIQFLTTINNEAKVRQATQSLVLGKAKVISYKELEEARRSVLKEMMHKRPKARENVVERARVVRPSQRKTLQRRQDVGESARVQSLRRQSQRTRWRG